MQRLVKAVARQAGVSGRQALRQAVAVAEGHCHQSVGKENIPVVLNDVAHVRVDVGLELEGVSRIEAEEDVVDQAVTHVIVGEVGVVEREAQSCPRVVKGALRPHEVVVEIVVADRQAEGRDARRVRGIGQAEVRHAVDSVSGIEHRIVDVERVADNRVVGRLASAECPDARGDRRRE